MSEIVQQRIDEFLGRLRESLRLSSDQAEEITAEVRGDLLDHIDDLRQKGHSEEEAVAIALEEMGNPYEMAFHVRRTVPLWDNRAVEVCRYVIAGGILLWSVYVLWGLRAWTYGFSPVIYVVGLLFFMPIVLVIWPRIVWRKNFLFGLLPPAVGVVLVLLVSMTGTSSEWGDAGRYLILTGIVATAIYVITLMQQRAQRQFVCAAALALVLCIEVPYQIEERTYRNYRSHVQNYLAGLQDGCGEYPDRQTVEAHRPGWLNKMGIDYSPRRDGDGYSLIWTRPLSRGFAIGYSSTEDRIWIND